jgi:hypothetical protein
MAPIYPVSQRFAEQLPAIRAAVLGRWSEGVLCSIAAGDFNSDHAADILRQSDASAAAIWMLDRHVACPPTDACLPHPPILFHLRKQAEMPL